MEKKDLKMYVAPESELMELVIEGQLMAGSPLDPDQSSLPNPDENMED